MSKLGVHSASLLELRGVRVGLRPRRPDARRIDPRRKRVIVIVSNDSGRHNCVPGAAPSNAARRNCEQNLMPLLHLLQVGRRSGTQVGQSQPPIRA